MKQFSNYQHVPGEPMTERDRQEVGSKFWNKGKWDNFVAPFLPKDCEGMTLVDMGCNAGLFLEQAEQRGFQRVIGIDRNKEAMRKAIAYKERIGGKYELRRQYMQNCIEGLPMTDYTVLANSHYYFLIDSWLEYLDKLRTKSAYCIIVTAQKQRRFDHASADLKDIRSYFAQWEEVGFIDELSLEGDPFPRRLWGLCFKNPILERVPIDSLTTGNNVQKGFYADLDKGKHYSETRYWRILKPYRLKKGWPLKRIERYVQIKVDLYKDMKKNGLLKPIVVTAYDAPHLEPQDRIIDGNHRYAIMKHLDHKSILIRRV